MDTDYNLIKFEKYYAKQLIVSQLGSEGECYAEDFKITDFLKNKYYDLIIKNKKILKNADILDIGSNLGHWSVLFYLNGANSVTCIEPRKNYVDGLNNFAIQEKLNIKAIQGIHSDCIKLGKNLMLLCYHV